jgi:hypothetical protein
MALACGVLSEDLSSGSYHFTIAKFSPVGRKFGNGKT